MTHFSAKHFPMYGMYAPPPARTHTRTHAHTKTHARTHTHTHTHTHTQTGRATYNWTERQQPGAAPLFVI